LGGLVGLVQQSRRLRAGWLAAKIPPCFERLTAQIALTLELLLSGFLEILGAGWGRRRSGFSKKPSWLLLKHPPHPIEHDTDTRFPGQRVASSLLMLVLGEPG